LANCEILEQFVIRHAQALLDELADRRDRVVSSRGRRTPRGVKRKMSKFPLRPRRRRPARVSLVTIHVRKR
jgi:hypothetical protein